MKLKYIISFLIIYTLFSCTNEGEKIIPKYLKAINDIDKVELEKILSVDFKLSYLDSTYNKTQFKNLLNSDNVLQSQTKLINCKKLNDSIYLTKEVSTNLFQRLNTNIPPFERGKEYCIKDGAIRWIKSDTLVGTNETGLILNYLSTEFSVWLVNQKAILDTLKVNSKTYSFLITEFYKSYPVNKVILEKSYRKDKFVEVLKSYKYQDGAIDITFERAFKQIAGLEGTIEWKSFTTSNYASNPNIRAVEVIINRNKKDSKYNTIKLQYLVNIQNEYVELKYGEVNGKPQSIFNIAMTVSLLLDSGAYI